MATLVNEVVHPGHQPVRWNPDGMAGGVYVYRLLAGELDLTRRMILMR